VQLVEGRAFTLALIGAGARPNDTLVFNAPLLSAVESDPLR
jgi:hypothetical protein